MKFNEILKSLRLEKKLNQKDVAEALGIDRTTYTKYETGKSEPDFEITSKIANYFDVSIDYLLGKSDIRNPEKIVQDKLTEKDKKDIAKDLEKMMNDLEHADGLMFYNEPITDDDRELLKQALEFGLRMAKIKNKEKYTPKKYRK
ncbi:helix-turn-helix transcriptional regulator [Thermoanaerobacterium thermosaccharolyticum]|uniref:helix-turn-helix domain-containing protein n=1 Tax=Thermoanaerobacterium thermosaccharolyticum TaxID=1517 RepID=UPI003D2CDA1B